MYACMHVCMYVWACAHSCLSPPQTPIPSRRVLAHTRKHTLSVKHTHTHTYTHTHIHTDTHTHIHTYTHKHILTHCHARQHVFYDSRVTLWRRVIGCLIFFIGHFSQKSPIISGSFAKHDCNLRHPMRLRHPVLRHTRKHSYFIIHTHTHIHTYTDNMIWENN